MAFKEGNTGRPKGSIGKSTKRVREQFNLLLDEQLGTLSQDLKGLTAHQRVKAVIELAKFVVPTYKSIEVESTPSSERPNWLDEILDVNSDTIKDKLNDR